eukprot:gene1813-955_t
MSDEQARVNKFQRIQKLLMIAAREESEQQFSSSKTSYIKSIDTLLDYLKSEKNERCKTVIKSQAQFALERAESIKNHQINGNTNNLIFFIHSNAIYCYEKALDYDTKKEYEKALIWYTESTQQYIDLLKHSNQPELKKKITQILDRAEKLKRLTNTIRRASSDLKSIKQNCLSDKEIEVLRESSIINDKLFLPWIDAFDKNEELNDKKGFIDPDGVLKLSEQQEIHFHSWKRISEIIKKPTIISDLNIENVTQYVVSDCSFVASLIVSAIFESKYKKKLISNLIYPQNQQGEPIINPSGKYAIKLFFNGIQRKVIIDDYFPIDKFGNLLTSYSKNELWICLLEKAYMKLNGGYSFQGSNSGIDIHHLTGWIPEEILLKSTEFNHNITWKRLTSGYSFGDCLITASTGDIDSKTSNDIGLFSNHAYAVLDVKEISNLKLIKLKNPWKTLGWKGKFSSRDKKSWSFDLMKELNYDLKKEYENDEGIFWLDFDSLCQYFSTLHLSWNPELFNHSSIRHISWKLNECPIIKKDTFNMSYNPQYQLMIKGKGIVWIMLTKHVKSLTTKYQDYITFHVYQGEERKLYKGIPLIEGVYSNNPHYLISLHSNEDKSHFYTLLLSQYDEMKPIRYSLKVYSTVPIYFNELKPYPHKSIIFSEWNKLNSGGSVMNTSTYCINPQFELIIKKTTDVILSLETIDNISVNIVICQFNGERVHLATTDIVIATSGDYRNSYCFCELKQVQNITLTVVVSTYYQGEYCPFTLKVESKSHPIQLLRL